MTSADTKPPMAQLDTTRFVEQLQETTSHEFYGVKVMWIGEDGDVLVLGHPGKRRALAAANRLARVDAQLVNLFDEPGIEVDESMVRENWAVPAHTNSCKYVRAFMDWCCQDPAEARGERPPVVEVGQLIREGEDCDCAAKGDDEWYIRYVDHEAPGAFPITEIGGF